VAPTSSGGCGAWETDGPGQKADARNGTIGGDKAKTQTYCQIVDLGQQMNQAVSQRDIKRANALAHGLDQLKKQLPEFGVLSKIVERADLNSPDGREIASIIGSLNHSCPKQTAIVQAFADKMRG
jgi:hypothetical protein